MDLFGRCDAFHDDAESARDLGYPANPRMLQALGLYPYFLPIEESEGSEVVVGGKRMVMLGSNNYLGLTTDPRLREAARAAIDRYGTGCTGSRLMNGTLELHLELEARLARFLGTEAALVFTTGFQANLGVIGGLLRRGDLVVADRSVHASAIDAIRLAREAHGIEARFFRHGNLAHLESILRAHPPEQGKLVVVDGVFSMEGDLADLPGIVRLCRTFGARLLVDDAHGLGVLGQGRGTAAHLGCGPGVDLVVGTFSKALASIGGFVAGPRAVVHWIQHFARPFVFSASLPPASVATVQAALDVIEAEPERVARVNRVAASMRERLTAMGLDVGRSETPVVPVVVGDQFRCVQAWKDLCRDGVYVNVALPPAVPPARSLLRTSYMATLTDEQLERVAKAFQALADRVRRRGPDRPRERAGTAVPVGEEPGHGRD
jgi:8-amino-7-oxononanoate synthase